MHSTHYLWMELHTIDTHLLIVDTGHNPVGRVRAHLELVANSVQTVPVRQQHRLHLCKASVKSDDVLIWTRNQITNFSKKNIKLAF